MNNGLYAVPRVSDNRCRNGTEADGERPAGGGRISHNVQTIILFPVEQYDADAEMLLSLVTCHRNDRRALRESFPCGRQTRQFNANVSVFRHCVVFLVTGV